MRLKTLQQKYGDLHEVIPEMVNELGQREAARKLGVSASTVNKWLKENGYTLTFKYIKQEQQA